MADPEELPPGAVPVDELPPGAEPVADEPAAPAAPARPMRIVTPDEKREQELAAQNVRLGNTFDVGLGFHGGLEKHAGVIRLARDTGTSPDVVETNYEKLKKTYEQASFNPSKWRDDNPELARMVLEHPDVGTVVTRDEQASWLVRTLRRVTDQVSNAVLANDAFEHEALAAAGDTASEGQADLSRQAIVENEVATNKANAPQPTQETQNASTQYIAENARELIPLLRYREAARQTDLNKLQFSRMIQHMRGADTYETDKQLLALQQGTSELPALPGAYGETGGTKVASEAAGAAAGIAEPLKEAGVAASVGGALGAGVGFLVGRTPAAAAAGARTGASFLGKSGMAEATFRIETGGEYARLMEATTDDGKHLTDEQVWGGSLMYGSLASIVQLGMMHESAKAFAPMLGAEQFAGLMKDRGFAAIAARVGKAWAKESGTVGGQQAAAEGLREAITYLSRSRAGKVSGPVLEPQRILEAGASGLELGAAVGGFAAASGLHGEMIRENQTSKAGLVVHALSQLSETPSAKAAPEAIARAVHEATVDNGMPVKSLYVDAPAFVRLFQGHAVDPGEAAVHLLGPEGPKKLAEALQTGSKIEVPVADYLEKWGHTDAAAQLAEHTTTSPHLLTPAEQLARRDEIRARADEIVKANEPPASPAEKAMGDALERQLVASGAKPEEAKKQVLPVRAFLRTQAEQFGVPADELFRNHLLSVEKGAGAAPAAALEQEAFNSTPTLLSLRADSLTSEERATEHLIDPVSGLRNRRAFDAEPVPAGKQVAVITSTDVKPINDHSTAGGHNVANGLLRAIGATLGEAHPEAARSGTSFLLHVKDRAELDQVLATARAAAGENVSVRGSLGGTKETAFASLDKSIETARSFKRLPPRGELSAGVDVAGMKFGEERAQSKAPAAAAAEIGAVKGKEYFDRVYRTPEGLLTAEGWNALPRKANVSMFDMRGLKKANTEFSTETGDRMLEVFKKALRDAGAADFDVAHLSGDEFAAQADDAAVLKGYVAGVYADLDGITVDARRPGGAVEQVPVEFRHGIGKDIDAADRDLNARRREGVEARVLDAAGNLPTRQVDLGRGERAEPQYGRNRTADYVDVAARPEALRRVEQPADGSAADPRGYTDFAREGLQRVFRIALNPKADLSTFLHESGHVFLEVFADLAERPDAPDRVKADFATTLEQLGAKDRAGIGREQHEKFARSFEAYLMEGKAPSRQLAGAFARFRLWLRSIYQSVSALKVQLSPELRGVFDRLLATDEEISNAQRDMGPPLFSSPVQAGMEGAEWQAYLEARQHATSHAAQSADLRTAKAQLRETETWWQDEEAALREKALTAYDELPAVKATQMLEAAVKNFPDAGSLAVHDLVAQANGFPDAAAMLKAISETPKREDWANIEAAQQMAEKHPDVLSDRDRLRDVVQKGLHGDFTADVLLREMKQLQGKVDQRLWRRLGMHPVESTKLAAHEIVGNRTLDELSEAEALRAERTAAGRATRSAAKGDFENALVQKQQQLVNMFIVKETADALSFRDKFQALGKRLSDPKAQARLGLADVAYRDTVGQLLGAMGMGPEIKGSSLEKAVARATADGHQVDFDADAVRELLAKPRQWDSLTVGQAKTIHDALQNLNHVATITNELELAGKKVGRQFFIQSVAERVASVRKAEPLKPYSRTARGLGTAARHLKNAAAAALEDIETVAERFDGGAEGPMHDLLINSRIEARTKEVELAKRVLEPIRNAWAEVPAEVRKLRKQLVDVGDLLPVPDAGTHSPVWTRDQLWMLFLNSGNEGNLQRLVDGNGWSRENISKALGMLSKPEAKFLQGVLDSMESLYPDIAANHERRTGLPLGKVEATPIRVGGEQYRGGYFPLRYDPEASYVGERQELNDVKDLNAPRNYRPATSKGYTKARVDQVREPVILDWSVVPSHFAQVLRDLSHSEWVRQTGSVLMDPAFRDVAKKYLGTEQEKELVPWLRDVANARADSAAGHQSDIMRAIGPAMRSRIAVAAMGLNLPSLARHTMDPFSTFVDSHAVPLGHIAAAYLKVANPANWGWEGFGLSKEIAFHDSKLHDNLRLELARIGPKHGLTEKATEVMFAAHSMVDHFTTRVVFRAAFDHAKSDGLGDGEAAQRADGVVRRALPSGDIAEKPPILRTKSGWASAIMFYGYASKMYNLRARLYDTAVRNLYQAGDGAVLKKSGIIAKAAGAMLALGVIGSMGKFLAGRGPTRKEDPLEWLAGDATLAALDDVPAVGRPTAQVAWQLISGEKGPEVSIASAPEMAVVQGMLTNLQRAGKKAEDDGDDPLAEQILLKAGALLMAIGPAAQAQRTIGYAKRVHSGAVDVRNPADLASGLLYGQRKNPEDQPRNPLNLAADLIDGQ